ncbi:hypothetical protein P3655_06465 [Vibrio parahaemolyticus]|uniref:hypothetical protein n=1 Tax=Vibrio parahaemolyticus TaxID=670 RepID=UPI00146C9710|nr:hypothetical protein [Vibrio parahaemolyticus]MDF5224652.1 hypothetical protein [Vibrio parahaemolyticus]MDF5680582.1 hypothetical protein [Vibrio parahaemolyticus]NMU10043.1 hypothetical protein [Vibrio parahaemolyticus]HBC3871614.1 hypothetical protein [Vibrio parahaemolyticus]HCE3405305.1 hypothetical protein [Vibrio parahaemolyticus]
MEALFANFFNWFFVGKVFPFFGTIYYFLFGNLGENDVLFLAKALSTIIIFPFTYAVLVRLKGGMFWSSFWRAIKDLRWVALSTAITAVGGLLLLIGDGITILFGLPMLTIGLYGYYIVYIDLKEFAEDQLDYLENGNIR